MKVYLTLYLSNGYFSERYMPANMVLESICEDRVKVEEGTSFEAGALSSTRSTHQNVGEENQKAVSLV